MLITFYMCAPATRKLALWVAIYENTDLKLANATNHELLFDYLSKTIDTITLQSQHSEITVLGDFNVYNPNWLTHSPHITSPDGHDAEAFAIVNDLSQLISEPTRIPDHSGDKANTLNLLLTSNPDICSNPILDSPFGNSGHCPYHVTA